MAIRKVGYEYYNYSSFTAVLFRKIINYYNESLVKFFR